MDTINVNLLYVFGFSNNNISIVYQNVLHA